MSRSLYLIAPKSTVPNHYGADFIEHWGFSSVQWIADVTLTTLAALAPPDFTVRLCDEAISPIDFDTSADFIGLTGKITQRERMIEVAAEFRRRGKTVLIGGPSASLSPGPFRQACDVLVRGEIEEIASDLFSDLRGGRWREEYDGGRPDLARSPIPQWSLYPNHRAVVGALQTSRGCPFDCEFCDVIPYLGRKQRHKPVGNVLAELDVLYGHGYREVFLTDDNFTVYRRRAKEVADALRRWNERPDREPVFFTTQASIDAARDEELLGLCAGAGLNSVFVGIETPNEAALREANKRQNLLDGPVGQIEKFLAHGIMVRSGMMVGFDADGPDVFERQFEFAMATPIPNFSVGAVVAPEATPLHARMRKSGRLIEGGSETAAVPWETNVAPLGMTREQLSIGMKWLANRLYSPEFFGDRLLRLIRGIEPPAIVRRPRGSSEGMRARERLFSLLMKRFLKSDGAAKEMAVRVARALSAKPEAGPYVAAAMHEYVQVRCLYDRTGYWEPRLAGLAAPSFRAAAAGAVGAAAADRRGRPPPARATDAGGTAVMLHASPAPP